MICFDFTAANINLQKVTLGLRFFSLQVNTIKLLPGLNEQSAGYIHIPSCEATIDPHET